MRIDSAIRRRGPGALALAAALLLPLAGCRGAPPRLVVTAPRQELGELTAGDQARATFVVRNSGGQPLRIASVEGNCGCLAPSYPKRLAPGATGEILVRLESQPNWRGRTERKLKIKSNDPRQPEQEITVVADVKPLITLKPDQMVVEYGPGEVILRDIQLTPLPGSGIQLRDARTSSPAVRAKVQPQGGGSARLQLDIGPWDGPGDSTVTVGVATSHPKLGEIQIPVHLQARTGVVTEPSEIMLASMPAQPDGRELGKIRVFTRSGALRVLGVETGHPGVRAAVQEATPGQAYDVKLQTAGLRPGPLSLQIRITTDDPRHPVVTVRFEATVT